MEIRVLGPVELVDGGHPLSLPTMPRRLLAMLVLRAGEACSADRLIEALWVEAPPASAAKLLQVYVSQLRKALPEPGCIHTGRSSYVLDLADGVLDAARFEWLLKEAKDMKREANPALAASLLRRALSLWRGAAYGEFTYEEFAHAEAERLEELRLVCLEARLEAEVALGRADELLAELRGLSTAHPLRERLQAQAMLALYRCGRQTEALALYAEIHVRLRDELGLDPG